MESRTDDDDSSLVQIRTMRSLLTMAGRIDHSNVLVLQQLYYQLKRQRMECREL